MVDIEIVKSASLGRDARRVVSVEAVHRYTQSFDTTSISDSYKLFPDGHPAARCDLQFVSLYCEVDATLNMFPDGTGWPTTLEAGVPFIWVKDGYIDHALTLSDNTTIWLEPVTPAAGTAEIEFIAGYNSAVVL